MVVASLIVILNIVSKVMIGNYRNSIYFVIIIWHLTVNLLNKFLKHFRWAIIVIATYMEKALLLMSYLFSKVSWPSGKYVLQSGCSALFIKPLQFNDIRGSVPVLAKL